MSARCGKLLVLKGCLVPNEGQSIKRLDHISIIVSAICRVFGRLLIAASIVNRSVASSSRAESMSHSAEKAPSNIGGIAEANTFRVDLLLFLRNGLQTHQFCSYDRAGDNYDAEYFPLYMETNGASFSMPWGPDVFTAIT
jgi:hypothetical protein